METLTAYVQSYTGHHQHAPAAYINMSPVSRKSLEVVSEASETDSEDCSGCVNLACVAQWKKFNDIPQGVAAERWFRYHNFCATPSCTVHGTTHMVPKGNVFVCHALVKAHCLCRQTASQYEPLLTTQSKISCEQLLLFFAHVANNSSVKSITVSLSLNKNTIATMIGRLGVACFKYQQCSQASFVRAAVDETYVGARKYQRGKRARKRGFWFVTMTEIERDGSVGRSVWQIVKKRDRKTLESFINKHLASSKSVIFTDCHKGYRHLSELCRHFCVNHSKEYKTLEGYHTNHAEGVHSVVKRFLRSQHNGFGRSSSALKKNVALQTVKLCSGSTADVDRFSARLRNILLVVKNHWGGAKIDDVSSVSSDSVPEEHEAELKIPRVHETPTYTAKGKVDKRRRIEATPPPPPDLKDDEATDNESNDGGDAREKLRKECYASLGRNGCLLSEVIVDVITEHLTEGFSVVDPRVAGDDITPSSAIPM